MADAAKKENPTPNREKADPTIRIEGVVAEYPEGSHPIAPLAEQHYSAVNKEYGPMEDKPDPSTVANVELRADEK